ncbi:hypothetical protein R3P38DRAFT_2969526 [Favolaschia claudopus]|uniref:ubiquitinyl hydrolase 1 n=1 Tax=Favolaschia claudopus TaxID=2862362 RepID=A0AAW0B511_9AGAR
MVKRKREDASSKGLAAGEPLKRTAHAIIASSWGWVGSEASETAQITEEHLSATCGLSKRNTHPFCRNKFTKYPSKREQKKPRVPVNGEIDEDIIVISSDEEEDPTCVKRHCKNNPNCLNYLGQKKWEDEEDAREMFMGVANLGDNPAEDARDPDLPVGLKNLGATCYANASLQVWFRDITFRSGVYNCQPADADKFKDSPIFQLQVTFAALQESTQSVFNPTKLVESLELRTTEQQDAQEFSKLFMSHLDAEFKKQSNPALQSLITDQFQGKQVYGTICSQCRSVSARDTDFLEIEINFKNNAHLEDSIADLLQEESLSGDNQYRCSTCNSLQDATRYTELASLPPVLHFSLLRFVYDLASDERRKSKHAITFPLTLDMTRFLGNAVDRKSPSTQKTEDNLYELRGVLLHKGKSAYHGHYEAQVFDAANGSWFQFNDEIVTKIKKLGDKGLALNENGAKKEHEVIDVEAEENGSVSDARNKQRENARKRRRVDDSDDETPPAGSSKKSPVQQMVPDPQSRISSKDAYMLIYARKEPCSQRLDPPTPPPEALAVVETLNTAHEKACEDYAEKEKAVTARFAETRRKVLDIYQSWTVNPDEKNYVVLSSNALESWLEKHAIKAALAFDNPVHPQRVSIQDILCPHNLYHHNKAPGMKRITQEAYDKIVSETQCVFEPALSPNHICRSCVEETFLEKLYALEHPVHISKFDAVVQVDIDLESYWISKAWLKDWKLAKPKMHICTKGDRPPDFEEYKTHVRCEHDGLCLNSTNRIRISKAAAEFLRSLFPQWEPTSGDLEPCLICDGLKNMGAEDRIELRRHADEEKGKLKHMFDNALAGNISLLIDIPCALVPVDFLQAWREWLVRPTEKTRPGRIDTEVFFCDHGLLTVDPNCPNDLDGHLVVIQRSDWNELQTFYPAGPMIAVEKSDNSHYVHDIPVCADCRQQRKTDWTSTEITIRKGKRGSSPGDTGSSAPITYTNGARQSKRLRQAREAVVSVQITVTKSTTVKDMKVQLQKDLDIPTICQRLFYGKQELDDNAATVESLQILAHSVIDLREENEVHEISDSEEPPKKKGKRREEGGGFGGTVLGRSEHRSSSPPKAATVAPPTEKACGACTFVNPVDELTCNVCQEVL